MDGNSDPAIREGGCTCADSRRGAADVVRMAVSYGAVERRRYSGSVAALLAHRFSGDVLREAEADLTEIRRAAAAGEVEKIDAALAIVRRARSG